MRPLLWKMMCGLWFFPSFYSATRCCREEKTNSCASLSRISPFQDLYVSTNAEYMHRGIAGYALQTIVQVSWRCKVSVAWTPFRCSRTSYPPPPRPFLSGYATMLKYIQSQRGFRSSSQYLPFFSTWLCKSFVLRSNRKVVLPDIEAKQ